MGTDLISLREMSARLGRDIDLVQAGGGNTSIKTDGTLWVKASGKWLSHAAGAEEIFLPVPLDDINASIQRGEEYATEYAGLRPSVETTLHAVMPHPCVVHVHGVNTLAWAARADGPECFANRLRELRWAWIPYIHPGLPLALRIRKSLESKPDVLIMQNHGIVAGGSTCEEAEALLLDTERRLELPQRPTAPPDLAKLPAGAGWSAAEDLEVHGLATDAFSCSAASGGTLYPDHCVYLGHAVAVCRRDEMPEQAVSRYHAEFGRRPPVLLCAGLGVLTEPALSRAAREMLICLARVVRRIPEGAPLHYLEYEQVARLMNWDAEHYRQAVARQIEERSRV